ncbi:E3 ubiquitin-protein ligase [Forsythia ovata]|uniref:E3 ubiquitin-protein ligase n=1 Tax=Forsythia ovata TaxID=205694 RepID=A0ABD1QQL2_9LAMI
MSKRVLCKFFAHGACLKGDHCEFSHDWKAPPNNICTFYQKGVCAYGSRCRYDHIKVSRLVVQVFSQLFLLSFQLLVDLSILLVDQHGMKNLGILICQMNDDVGELRSVNPADLPICSFAAAGNCPHGEKCPRIHGDLCPTCGKHCLHPFRPQEREEHVKTCEKMQRNLEALKHSQEIECSVCLERVLSKSAPAERKFGILSECDHPFCISCIRNWRSSSPASGMDVNSALRACPICRKLSYFVIPSVIWYCSKEEKQEILDSYKAKLRSIDCKHFDFGNGTCPFGTSCFYKHAYRDGRLEEVVIRHLGAEDGNTVIAKNIRLSDFLSNLQIR